MPGIHLVAMQSRIANVWSCGGFLIDVYWRRLRLSCSPADKSMAVGLPRRIAGGWEMVDVGGEGFSRLDVLRLKAVPGGRRGKVVCSLVLTCHRLSR
jgi:hypothetical protein